MKLLHYPGTTRTLKAILLSLFLFLQIITVFPQSSFSVNGQNFEDHALITSNFSDPMAMTFLPDGRMLILQRQGVLSTISLPSVTLTPFMTITNITTSGEHGLINVVLDPLFATNHYFYIYYTSGNNKNRISRFTDTGDPAGRLASETLIWENPAVEDQLFHTGGAMDFGNDNLLYLATGDNFNPTNAQDSQSAKGKIIRLNKDGSIPAGNPFINNPHYLPEIYAIGLRNPFKGSFDKPTNRFMIGMVGGNVDNSKEQVEVLIPGTSQLTPGNVAVNFGWPDCGDQNTNPDGSCTNTSYTSPVFSYPLTPPHGARAIIGGPVYRGAQPAASPNQFPAAYNGVYFYADYAAGGLYYLTFDAPLHVSSNNVFKNTTNTGIRTIIQGPDGSLFYFKASLNDPFPGELHQIVYNSGNLAPSITATASPTSGNSPLTVNFSASATDPENDALTYTWNFGDGATANNNTVTHQYNTNGRYTAQASVTDGINTTQSDPIIIQAGIAPTLTVQSAAGNSPFHIGQTISFSASATDDGPLSESSYTYSIVLQHGLFGSPGSHQHPILNGTGTSFSYQVETDHNFDGDISLRVTFTVIDSDGLITEQSVTVYPDMTDITFNTNPQGLGLTIDGVSRTAPFTLHEIKGHNYTVSASGQCMNGIQYGFSNWSDNGAATHTYTIPVITSGVNLTANFSNTGACSSTCAAMSFDGTDDWINIPDINLPGDFTIEAWVKLSATGTNHDVITGLEGDGMDLNFYNNRLHVWNGATDVATAGVDNPTGVWTHYAVTRSNNQFTIYINGQPDNSATINNGWNGAFTPQAIGRMGNFFLTGQLDEVRIWNVARTATDIQSSYNQSISSTSTGLVAYYKFNESTGQTVADATGNNSGTLGATSAVETTDPVRVTTALPPPNTDCQSTCAAMSFDGVDDWINIQDINLPGDFTIEAWVKLGSTGTNHDVITGLEGDGMDLNFYNNRFRLWNGATDLAIAGVDNQPGVWTHYAVTRSNNQFAVYINGQPDNSATINNGWNGTFTPQAIGRMGNFFLTGQLDEVRIWNVARTATDIQSFYNQSISSTSTGLVAYYKFNENATDQNVADATGNYPGTLGATSAAETTDPVRVNTALPPPNTDCPTAQASAPCGAVGFDGIDDWINIQDISLPNDFTIEAWVKLNGAGSDLDVVTGQETDGMDLNFFNHRFRLWNGVYDVAIAGVDNPAGVWTHYAITRSNNQCSIYINGQPDNSATLTNGWNGAFTPGTLGRMNNNYLAGQLDEVRIWNVARTAAQIQSNYNQSISSTTPGLVAYYKFNETATSQNVADATGNYPGTLGSNATVETSDPSRVTTALPPPNTDCQAGMGARTMLLADSAVVKNRTGVTIYPNPTTGNSTMTILADHTGLYSISVSDLSGRIVYRQQVFVDSKKPETVTIKLPGDLSEIYLIEVSGNNTHVIKKILKIR